jgi:1,4-alpha-glucan branching enzyme
VRNFLLSSALFWLDEVPHRRPARRRGRVDALPRLLAQAGEWIPNQYGGRENLEAIEFLRS